MMDWLNNYGSLLVMLAFFAIFLGFAFWAYRPANKRKFESYGHIPLEESRDGE